MNRDARKKCRRLADATAWALKALPPDRATRFAMHMAGCPLCTAEVDATRATVAKTRAFAAREPSPGLTSRIMRALPARGTGRETAATYLFLAPAFISACAAVLVLLCGAVLLHTQNAGRRDAAATFAEAMKHQAEQSALWLAAQQEPDGTWRPARTGGNDAYRPAVTALAILALCRQDPEYHAAAIQRGVDALIALQTKDGAFSDVKGARHYNHAFASHTLLGLPPGIASQPAVRAACRKAIDFSLQTQNACGAWDYEFGGEGNTALTAWQLTILIQAREQGWGDSGGHLRRGLAWLQGQSDGHEFGYRKAGTPQPGHDGLTLTAISAATLLEAARTYPSLQPAADEAVSLLRSLHPERNATGTDSYRNYFLTRVAALVGSHTRMKAIEQQKAAQQATLPNGSLADDDAWRSAGGDLYATSLAVLSRHL